VNKDNVSSLAMVLVLLGLFGLFGLEKLGVSQGTMNLISGVFLSGCGIGIFYRGVIVTLREGKAKWIFDARSTNFSFRKTNPAAFWGWTTFYAVLSLLLVFVTINLLLHNGK
jgi:hypothetical protein